MLNDKVFRAIFKKPEFKQKPQVNKKQRKKPRVKESTLKLVVGQIKENKGITRQRLKERTDLSFSCLNRCFDHLLDKEIIKRTAIKNAGAYKVYAYYVKDALIEQAEYIYSET